MLGQAYLFLPVNLEINTTAAGTILRMFRVFDLLNALEHIISRVPWNLVKCQLLAIKV